VITYDRRGYGASVALPVEPGISRHVADLGEVVGDRRVVAVGHSFGGLVALAFAEQFPARVAAVMVYEPPLSWLPWWSRSRGATPSGDVTPALAAERFFRSVVSDQAWERLDPKTREQRCAEGPALLADLAAARAGAPFDPAALVVPVVVARGEHAVERHARGTQTLAEWLGETSVKVIAGAHHGAHMSHPDSFAALVETAIDRTTQGVR
jgi:pimeloyl-ACP methyl ester carboxylesterase